jgi:hypothetical protein
MTTPTPEDHQPLDRGRVLPCCSVCCPGDDTDCVSILDCPYATGAADTTDPR